MTPPVRNTVITAADTGTDLGPISATAGKRGAANFGAFRGLQVRPSGDQRVAR